MRFGLAAVIAFGAVGCGVPARPPLQPSRATVAAPPGDVPAVPESAPYDVVAAELGEPGVLGKIAHRARLARLGKARTMVGGESFSSNPRAQEPAWMVAVLGESADQLRVVVTADHVRAALWVDRADAQPTAIATVELIDAAARATPPDGAWLLPGAYLQILAARGAVREVALVDDVLEVSGTVPASALGQVWIASAARRARDAASGNERHPYEEPVEFPETSAWVDGKTIVRAQPAPDAAAIASIVRDKGVIVVGERGGATEIEVVREGARVRGFVPASAVHAGPPPELLGSIGVEGFGTSGGRSYKVTAGACLYDRPDGDVIGIVLDTASRIVRDVPDHGSWYRIEVGTRWGRAPMFLHGPADAPPDNSTPKLESCRT